MGLSDGRCVRDAGGAIEGKVGVWDCWNGVGRIKHRFLYLLRRAEVLFNNWGLKENKITWS